MDPSGPKHYSGGRIHFFISEKTGADDENDLNLQLPLCKKEEEKKMQFSIDPV
jgi:hypothetical protein